MSSAATGPPSASWTATPSRAALSFLVGLMKDLPARLTERYGGLVDAVNVVFGPPYANLQARQREMFVRLGRILPELKRVEASERETVHGRC